MHDVALVQKVVCLEDLVSDRLDSIEGKAVGCRLQLLKQRPWHIVEDQIQFAILAKDRPEIDDVDMAVLTEYANLAHHGLSYVWVFILTLLELLYGHDPPRLLLLRLEDFSVGALADHLQYAVFVHLSWAEQIIFRD